MIWATTIPAGGCAESTIDNLTIEFGCATSFRKGLRYETTGFDLRWNFFVDHGGRVLLLE